MRARDIMTSEVVCVGPETPAPEIARLLLEKHISAVPVIDGGGAAVGMVSEGDLIGRSEAERETRRDWWLALLAEGETLSPEFLAGLRAPERRARDVMAAPVVTVGEETDLTEIARVLTTYRIKRVPVQQDGRVVGIVSRADLLRGLARGEAAARPEAARRGGMLASALLGLEERFEHVVHGGASEPAASSRTAPEADRPSAREFQKLMSAFTRSERQQRETQCRAAAEQRRRRAAELAGLHISEEGWRALLRRAREAAEHGEKEFLLLRFPSALCGDGGRAINVEESDWPASLRGEAAELYLRWERELKPQGFHLAARILDFPGGKPGDVGLFLAWGE